MAKVGPESEKTPIDAPCLVVVVSRPAGNEDDDDDVQMHAFGVPSPGLATHQSGRVVHVMVVRLESAASD